MGNNLKHFITKFSSEIEEGNAAIFAGAGLSVSAGYVDWKGLLEPLAKNLGLDIKEEHDLVSIAQYHCNEDSGGWREDAVRSLEEAGTHRSDSYASRMNAVGILAIYGGEDVNNK